MDFQGQSAPGHVVVGEGSANRDPALGFRLDDGEVRIGFACGLHFPTEHVVRAGLSWKNPPVASSTPEAPKHKCLPLFSGLHGAAILHSPAGFIRIKCLESFIEFQGASQIREVVHVGSRRNGAEGAVDTGGREERPEADHPGGCFARLHAGRGGVVREYHQGQESTGSQASGAAQREGDRHRWRPCQGWADCDSKN